MIVSNGFSRRKDTTFWGVCQVPPEVSQAPFSDFYTFHTGCVRPPCEASHERIVNKPVRLKPRGRLCGVCVGSRIKCGMTKTEVRDDRPVKINASPDETLSQHPAVKGESKEHGFGGTQTPCLAPQTACWASQRACLARPYTHAVQHRMVLACNEAWRQGVRPYGLAVHEYMASDTTGGRRAFNVRDGFF